MDDILQGYQGDLLSPDYVLSWVCSMFNEPLWRRPRWAECSLTVLWSASQFAASYVIDFINSRYGSTPGVGEEANNKILQRAEAGMQITISPDSKRSHERSLINGWQLFLNNWRVLSSGWSEMQSACRVKWGLCLLLLYEDYFLLCKLHAKGFPQ